MDWLDSGWIGSKYPFLNSKDEGNVDDSNSKNEGDDLNPVVELVEKLKSDGFMSLKIRPTWKRITRMANQEEVQAISDVLNTYATASGQRINLEKSSVYFSGNTEGEQRESIKTTLGIKEVERFESYLRLPTLVGRAKFKLSIF
ncbi:uncharacterized protein LOC142608998 [Castanea sativa]|uniref:uncharacterized protein LOC142608998 n=1 Tax=Castanea sativa TaxID=21020 RepID=UPI003F654755